MSADHDPMCVDMNQRNGWRYPVGCACDLIARVRADERQRARQRVFGLVERDPHPTRVVNVHDAAAAAAGGDA